MADASAPTVVSPPQGSLSYDVFEILMRILKYMFEGIVVATAAYIIPGKKMNVDEVLVLGSVAATTFAILDLFAPSVGANVRSGSGFAIGANLVGGFGTTGVPGPR